MASRDVLKSVLHNFLGTFTSRYSDHRGYWLFGQLPADLDRWTVDLRGRPPEGGFPLQVAEQLAVRKFDEQVAKAGLDPSCIREAALSWTRAAPATRWHGDRLISGHRVEVAARVVTDLGRTIERRRDLFVAPHDPHRESRRVRPDESGEPDRRPSRTASPAPAARPTEKGKDYVSGKAGLALGALLVLLGVVMASSSLWTDPTRLTGGGRPPARPWQRVLGGALAIALGVRMCVVGGRIRRREREERDVAE